MALITRRKSWIDRECLTHTDLNAEFSNITDNIIASDLTNKGMIERATDAEVVDGTDEERAVTPASLKKFIKAPGEIGGTTAGKVNCTTIDLDGGQIAFPATAVPHAGANILDDYEEGTYTPTITCATSGGYNLHADKNTLAYTKIGRLVTVHGQIDTVSENSPDGGLSMSLPFTPTNPEQQSGYAINSICIHGHGGTIITALGLVYTSTLLFYDVTDTGIISVIDNTDVDTVFSLAFDFSYITAL